MGDSVHPPNGHASLEDWGRRLAAYFRARGSATDADDLAQDTWVRYLTYEQERPVRESGALLSVIARRVWIDHVRRDRRRGLVMSSVNGDEDRADAASDFVAPTVSRLDLLAALRQLSLEDQKLIRWRFSDGQSLDYIAQRLQITPAACRQRMVRALRRVRQLVDERR